MQRMSDPYIYVRCENVSNGLEMSVLDSAVGASGPDVINSNILAKVFRDVEFISYHTQTGDDYFSQGGGVCVRCACRLWPDR